MPSCMPSMPRYASGHGLTLDHLSTYREHLLSDTLGRLGGFSDKKCSG
jgi:hypothetical protein